MRAIEGSRRGRTLRGLTGITVVSLLGLAVLSGNVLAGNTSKAVYFGSGPFPAGTSFNYDANYNLSFTPVNGGGVTGQRDGRCGVGPENACGFSRIDHQCAR